MPCRAISGKLPFRTAQQRHHRDNPGSRRDRKSTLQRRAIVIAPASPLQRQGSATVQGAAAPIRTIRLRYLDVASGRITPTSLDGSSTNGFIAAPVRDAAGRVIANDRILAITYGDIMPIIEKRVASSPQLSEQLCDLQRRSKTTRGHFPGQRALDLSRRQLRRRRPGSVSGRFPDRMCATGGEGAGDILCDLW